MKITTFIIALILSLPSLAQHVLPTASNSAPIVEAPLLWNAKAEAGVFITKGSHGFSKSAALQFDLPSCSVLGRIGRHTGQDFYSGNVLAFNQASFHIKKQTSSRDMRVFATAGFAYAWGDLNKNSDSKGLEANEISQTADEMISFPIELGFLVNLGDRAGVELSGYFAPSLAENYGGVRAALIFGRLK